MNLPLSYCIEKGLMNGIVMGKGNGILDPKGNATRAEAATMIMRFLERNK